MTVSPSARGMVIEMGWDLRPVCERKGTGKTILLLLFAAWTPVTIRHAIADPPAAEKAAAGGADAGQATSEEDESELGPLAADTDPTKPVIFGFRDEFYDLGQGLWRNVAIFRVDRAVLEGTRVPGIEKGFLMRADLPVVSFYNGKDTETGLGDLYGQVLIAPRISGPVFLAFGSGLVANTATDYSLGWGKWVVAPALVPVWFFPRRGLTYVKIQDWISFAGSPSRPDVHFLTVTPTFLWRLSKRWWVLADAETNTNWMKEDQTNYKAGFLVGRMLSRRVGVSLKAEVPFGRYRQGDWTVKAVLFATRF
jgi:hypothetical protein